MAPARVLVLDVAQPAAEAQSQRAGAQPGGRAMSKFLIEASYTAEGLKGLQKDKASGRLEALTKAVQSLNGKVESMHFALGDDDVIAILDLPDSGAAAALSAAVTLTGLIRMRTTSLLTVGEMDKALTLHAAYRGPGL
jgi:uncharacterized protein with GYD domain